MNIVIHMYFQMSVSVLQKNTQENTVVFNVSFISLSYSVPEFLFVKVLLLFINFIPELIELPLRFQKFIEFLHGSYFEFSQLDHNLP